MAKIELTLPAMGEGIIEATITKWLVKEGVMVEEDQPLLEIATDKVDSEIPSPVKGIVAKIIMAEGTVPEVGDILAVIETETEAEDPEREEVLREVNRITSNFDKEDKSAPSPEAGMQAAAETNSAIYREAGGEAEQTGYLPGKTPSGKFLTPLVRSIAITENISPGELDKIQGSGDGGRINKNDILGYLKNRTPDKTITTPGKDDIILENAISKDKIPVSGGAGSRVKEGSDSPEHTEGMQKISETEQFASPSKSSGISLDEGDRLIEMDRMRKLIAGRMVASKQTSPHVTSFIDVDVTELVRWRDKIKDSFRESEKQNITYTPVFIEAAARALRDYPMVNVSVDETTIIVKKNINIGIAVALPGGNLIVPVIKNADEKNLVGLVKTVNDLAHRSRINNLQPNEIRGGTFTITNFGTFLNTAGTPIINQPEAAILGTGAITKKPVVLETKHGDVIAIRHIMTLSLSYDHRVVDGALGGMFLQRIAEYLEKFDTERKI